MEVKDGVLHGNMDEGGLEEAKILSEFFSSARHSEIAIVANDKLGEWEFIIDKNANKAMFGKTLMKHILEEAPRGSIYPITDVN